MKLKYIIYTAIALLGVVAVLFTTGFFAPFNAKTAEKSIAEGKPSYITVNEGDKINACKIQIAQEKGIVIIPFEIEKANFATQNGIVKHNELTSAFIAQKWGNNWFSDILQSSDSLFRVIQKDTIVKIIEAQPDVKKLNHHLDSISNGTEQLFIWYWPEEKSGANVAVSRKLSDSSIAVFYYYEVNPYTLDAMPILY